MTKHFSTSPPVTTNRRERHKLARFMRNPSMTHSEYNVLPTTYAWAGCGSTSTKPNKQGWSNTVLYTAEPDLAFHGKQSAAHRPRLRPLP